MGMSSYSHQVFIKSLDEEVRILYLLVADKCLNCNVHRVESIYINGQHLAGDSSQQSQGQHPNVIAAIKKTVKEGESSRPSTISASTSHSES